ncbi:bactericidal permeability-increasing protein-like [Narcine bancroftii]|uniref:bactericidal permeability-increasing protein-like n=1 Tax=Narcine bancroftii TaxID=1343680 RepID=UPI003831BC44
MLPRFWILTTVLLIFPSCILSTNPGLKARVTQKALDYARKIGVGMLQQKLQHMTFPNMGDKVKIKHFGHIRYKIWNLHIYKFGLPQSSVRFSAGQGIQLSITNGYIGVKGKWKVKKRFIKLGGSIDVSVSRVSISETIGMSRDSRGSPSLRSLSCTSSVGHVSVSFHGIKRLIYKLFQKLLDKRIRSALNRQICPKVSSAVNGLNNDLKTMKLLININNFAEVDYSLVNQIQITNKSMELDFKGEFYRVGHHKEPPFKPPPISLPHESNSMLYLGISDFLANSAGFVYHEAGILQKSITDDMIPSSSFIRLNTKSFSTIIPGLNKLYPNMNMTMKLYSTRPPVLKATTNNLTVEAFGNIDVFAILPNRSLASLFVLNLDAGVSAQVAIVGMKLTGSIKLNQLKLSLVNSRVGPVPVSGLQLIMKIAISAAVLPKVNERLANGVPLPSVKTLKFINPKVMVRQNILVIATDLQYIKSSRYTEQKNQACQLL